MTQTCIDTTACTPDLGQLIAPEFFRALGDPNRIALLSQLAACGRPCTVSELTACCQVDISVVSRHLATLRQAGILHADKRGRKVYYAVDYPTLAAAFRSLAAAIDACCPPQPIHQETPVPANSRGRQPHTRQRREHAVRE